MDFYPKNHEQSLDVTQLSEISFPSHVSGLDSFVDNDASDESYLSVNQSKTTVSRDNNTKFDVSHSMANHSHDAGRSANGLSMFLKVSSPPLSQSASNSTLNESSMSLGKLEALQVHMQDSFLNSQSEDSEREKKLHQYLSANSNHIKTKGSLSDAIDGNMNGNDITQQETPNVFKKELNQTELDSLFLKDIRQRLHLSETDDSGVINSNRETDETLKEIDEQTILSNQNSPNIEEVEQHLREYTDLSGESFDQSDIGHVQRPNLDGNSSDSDVDSRSNSTSPATTFARSGLHTSRDPRFQAEDINRDLRNPIPERTLAEGGAEEIEPYGDGGGGGDGSSGHSDDDMGGDGGVAIRRSVGAIPIVTNIEESDDDLDHTSALSREQPVGESGGTPKANRPPLNRQVQFSTVPPTTSNDATPIGSNNMHIQPGESNGEQSRLSARYFLAASTPFKPTPSTDVMTSTLPANWMNQSSFHMSQMGNDSPSERTLVGREIAVATPSSAMLSRLRKVHGEAPDWTLVSMSGQANQTVDRPDMTSQANDTTLPNNLTTESVKKRVFNPFDSASTDTSLQAHLLHEFDNTISTATNQFKMTEKELDMLLDEDEKVIAMNNNSVYKETNETAVSEWSVSSKMNLVSPRNDSKEDGRMSVYFKSKSNELGQLTGEDGPRPKFSDDTKSIVTPPSGPPISLLTSNTRSSERDDTIPIEAWDKTYKKFDITPQKSTQTLYHSETPKTRLLQTHKRNSDTVFQKRQKRQLIGKDHDSSDTSFRSSQSIKNYIAGKQDIFPVQEDNDDIESSFKVPVTSGEANQLLESIRGRRLSLDGMSNEQIVSLAKCVSTLTNTDFHLAYNLLTLLPKQLSKQHESAQVESKQNILSATTLYSSIPENANKSSSAIFRSIADSVARPISSVIPMGSIPQKINSVQNVVMSSITPQNVMNNQYLQSSVGAASRSSDPQPTGLYYQTPHEYQRLAASVSPVRQNYNGVTRQEFITPGLKHSNYSTHSEYFPIHKTTMISGGHTFLPLIQNDSTNLSDQTPTDRGHNFHETDSLMSGKINGIYPNSIQYPKNISLDAACVNSTVAKVFKIHNCNSFWIQCQIKTVFMACNGHQIDEMGCLSVIPKITIEPNSFEDVKLKFHSKNPGLYVSKLEILAMAVITNDIAMEWQALPTLINIDIEVEHPDIEFLLNASNNIEFGEVPYGSSRSQELKILNKGKADVPLSFSISQDLSASLCCFELVDAQNGYLESKQSLELIIPGRKTSGLPIQASGLKVKFIAPSLPTKGDSISPKNEPERYSNYIEVKTVTKPSLFVSRVAMMAIVGVAKLHSLRTLQTISITTEVGKKALKSMPLQNAGNISLKLEALLVGSHQSYFSVSPAKIVLQPGEEKDIHITFYTEESITTESNLIVNLLPEGDQYKWHLHGYTSKEKTKQQQQQQQQQQRAELLCNKLALNWPGVSIGQSQLQKLVLRNNSRNENINLGISIAGNHSNFQIQNDFLKVCDDVNKYEQSIKPQAELPIHVLFAPSSFAMIKSSLILRALEGSTKYVIPLIGYGGNSNLEISGAKRLSDQFWIDLGNIYLGKTSSAQILIRNTGSRGGFVNMKCYSDLTARVEYPNSHVTIKPNKFILMENTSCHITLTFQPLQYDAIKCQEETHTAAHLVIYSGDEVLRKEYRRNKEKMVSSKASLNNILTTLQLGDYYENEENIKDYCSYSDINDWESFMYASMSRTVIALIATPQQAIMSSHKNIATNNTEDELHQEMIYQTPAVKLKPEGSRRSNSTGEKLKMAVWSVSPEKIVINTLHNESKGCKLLMVNYTDSPLPFEFIWPAQTLVITPSKDKIPPSSQFVIRIDAKPSFLSNEEIPWYGSLYIQCNGEQKCVQVEIRLDLCTDNSSPITNKLNVTQQELKPTSQHDLSLIPHRVEEDDIVTVQPHILEFPNTNINDCKNGTFTIQNNTTRKCSWVISSIAPPYFKNIDGTCGIVRATYSVFRFDKHSGILTEKQNFELPVTFLPRSGGVYSQFWDIEITCSRKQEPTKIRIELIGQGISTEKKHYSPDVPRKQIGTAIPIVMASKDVEMMNRDKNQHHEGEKETKNEEKKTPGVFVKEDTIKFTLTKVGETSEMKFRLCNNTNEVQKVRVSGFRSPFSVIMKHVRLSIRPMSYVRLPVYFSPTKSGSNFEGLLILTPESGESVCVKVVGRS